jgi:hypothetical protein
MAPHPLELACPFDGMKPSIGSMRAGMSSSKSPLARSMRAGMSSSESPPARTHTCCYMKATTIDTRVSKL